MELVPKIISEALTVRARLALEAAQALALEAGATAVEPQHIVFALARARGSLAQLVLAQYRLAEARSHLLGSARAVPSRVEGIPLSEASRTLLTHAARAAAKYQHRHVGTEHLLFGAISIDSDHYAIPPLKNLEPKKIRTHLESIFAGLNRFPLLANLTEMESSLRSFAANAGPGPNRPAAERTDGKRTAEAKTALAYFGDDLTRRAARGELDALIGRTAETNRLIQILCRRTKNNPVLIGEPGVGKTAIVQGLAQRLATGHVPDILRNRPLIGLDLGLLVAGTVFRGEFEHRLKDFIREAAAERAIVFIDELHTVIGAGSAQGSLDAANILKPSLTRDEVQYIGATTLDEYRRYIEKDAALERRFQPVLVAEATAAETRAILEALRPEYETHHRITIRPEAIAETVRLAERYLTDRRFPDKALDVLDEAAARVRLVAAVREEPNELARLANEYKRLTRDKEAAVLAGQYETATTLQNEAVSIKRTLAYLGRTAEATQTSNQPAPELHAAHVRSFVADITGIPIADIERSETAQLLQLEDRLGERVFGQPEAISAVASSLRRARAGFNLSRRPWGSFLFLGPSGVGKTELARALAATLFHREDALVKLDMSEYAEPHSMARLIGAPPGYVGYDDGGTLTERIRRTPFSVVLFDEIEKAHPQAHNLLLQILEDGSLTDGQGRRINFANTIVIMTSNIGTESLARRTHLGFAASGQTNTDAFERIRDRTLEELKQVLRPELINRIDHTIIFRPLDESGIASIVALHINDLVRRLAERGTTLVVPRKVIDFLALRASQKREGARLVRRVIEQHVEAPLATAVIASRRRNRRLRLALVKNRITVS